MQLCVGKLLSVLLQVKLCKIIGTGWGAVGDGNGCNITHTFKNKIESGQFTNVQVATSCGAVTVVKADHKQKDMYCTVIRGWQWKEVIKKQVQL